MDNPFAYIGDLLGIHWGWVAFAAWLALYLIVRKFIEWLVIGIVVIGAIASVVAYMIEPDAASLGEHFWSWGRLLAMILLAAYIPHLLFMILGLAGDGVHASRRDHRDP